MDRINQWINNAPGRRIDVDGAYGLQCKDVIDDYCLWLFNDWQNTIRPANAKEAFANSNGDFFEKILNNMSDPNLLPQRGDIIIWGAMVGNPYGHIAVVLGADLNGVDVIEQDGFAQTPARTIRRPWIISGGPVIGWLRPRPERIIGYVAPQTISPTDRKMEEEGYAREEPNTQSGVFQELAQGDVIAMKGYVTNGESIAGDTVWYVTARSGKYMSRQLFEDKELHDLSDLTPQPAPEPAPELEQDFSNTIIDVSNYQTVEVVNVFPKVAGVIVKAGWVGQQYGGNEFKLDPDAELFVTKAREAGKMLGLYWLPYFSTREEAEQNAEYFVKCIEALGNEAGELLFLDLEPDFEGTVEQIAVFSNIVLQKTGKQVFTYGGEAIIQKLGLPRVDWYPNYGNPDNYAHGSFIHQYSETLTIPGYDGKLDANVSNKSIDELRSMGGVVFPKPQETPENNETDTVPAESEKLQEVPNNRPKEEKMATPVFTKEDIEAIEKVTAEKAKLAQGLAETDEAQEIIKGISKRTKLVVYIIGDLLLGASAIAPQVAIAALSGDPYVKTNAISGVLATAGLFLLTMFGIYKNGKNK